MPEAAAHDAHMRGLAARLFWWDRTRPTASEAAAVTGASDRPYPGLAHFEVAAASVHHIPIVRAYAATILPAASRGGTLS